MSTYLVTQATGQQSRWVITQLLAAGAKVHAVVRDPQKIHSILESPGVTLFKGESTDYDSIFRAAQGCKGVFLNTFPIPGLEAQQAKTVAEACKNAGVESIVANTTVLTGDKAEWDDKDTEESGLRDYYLSKAAVEDAVRGAGFKTYTILRPGFINFDYLIPSVHYNFPGLATSGVLEHSYDDGARMPHTDGIDIGKYAAAALLNPDNFAGAEIELSNENLTIDEVRDVLAKVSGRDVKVKKRTPEEVEAVWATLLAQRFHLLANKKEFSSIIARGKEAQAKFGIPFTSLEEGLQREKDRLLQCLPAST